MKELCNQIITGHSPDWKCHNAHLHSKTSAKYKTGIYQGEAPDVKHILWQGS